MKPGLLVCFAALFATSVAMGQVPPGAGAAVSVPEIEAIRAPHQRALTTIRTTRDARINGMTGSYLAKLDRLQNEITSRGDLDGALQVKAEKERATGRQEPSPDDRKTMPAQLLTLRQAYDKERAPIVSAAQEDERQEMKAYLASLDALQKRLTTLNQLEKAVAVRNEKERVTAESAGAPAAAAAEKVAPGEVAAAAPQIVSTNEKLDAGLAAKIAAAAKSKSYAETETSGQKKDGWPDVPKEGALLVGFDFLGDHSEGVPDIRSIKPYYLTPEGIVAGKTRGELPKVTEKVMAHPGYAIAGLETYENPMRIQGIQITFTKIDPVSGKFDTNPSNSYKSKWYGTRGKGRPKVLGGDGKLVIGIYGMTGADADTIGLIQMP